ncbi:MAG: hypothetical protein ACREQY_11215, partial [Candidatus Binatia bacterium]
MTRRRGREATLWLLPLVVVALRAIPYLVARSAAAGPEAEMIPLGYNPKDLLSYVAFQRQLAEDGRWLWVNAFTTEPQSGRFFLLFHALLGATSAATGLGSFTVLELSRIPLTFAFFAVLWRFVARIYDDERTRIVACWLVGLSGGIDFVAKAALPLLPEGPAALVEQDLWHLQGWSTFAALHNPLWIAGLTLSLLTLAPILDPVEPPRSAALRTGLCFFILYWAHPYSAIVVLAVLFGRPLLGRLFG